MKIHRASRLLPLALLLLGTPSEGGTRPVALLSSAEVSGDAVLLSNVLPSDAPPDLQRRAEGIRLGTAPQDGATRTISREAIAAILERSLLPGSSFLIPEYITIRRTGRVVTRQEVFRAIQAAMGSTSPQGRSELRLEDIRLGPAVRISVAEPQLRVTQVLLDHRTGCVWFRLKAAASPEVLPFYVALRSPSFFGKGPLVSRAVSANATLPHPAPDSTLPILVEPGSPARLCVRSPDSKMVLTVNPMQRGRLGETIRVRLPGTAKILKARVAGKAYLDAIY